MKGDFSRVRFNAGKQYSEVLQQQGRVALDADANEQNAIQRYLRETTTEDVVGQYGGPVGNAGFELKIDVSARTIMIGPGRYYIDGVLVENSGWVNFDNQPFGSGLDSYTSEQLIDGALDSYFKTMAQFRLEVWQRLVTPVDDESLLEPALGQADTTLRKQTIWRVVGRLVADSSTVGSSVSNAVANLSPRCQVMYEPKTTVGRGLMHAGTKSGGDCGCQPIPEAGFQGLENQLYRVEIHTPGDLATATFKWSRENGSVITKILSVSGFVVTVATLGPDANLGFQVGQWVELADDVTLFDWVAGRPKRLYQIRSINPATMKVTLDEYITGFDVRHAFMRRWEQSGSSATSTGIPLSSDPVPLENGIEVSFSAGAFQTGDYWLIPARTATGQIDWPVDYVFQPPQFDVIHRAPLACLSPGGIVDDCRVQFSGSPAKSVDHTETAG